MKNEFNPNYRSHPVWTLLDVLTTRPWNVLFIPLSFWRNRWRQYRDARR